MTDRQKEINKGESYLLSPYDSKTIDIAKVILSVFVVFVHAYRADISFKGNSVELLNPVWLETIKFVISRLISGCAVPSFFLFSSILLYKKHFYWKNNIKKKIRTLIIPYFILNAFWVAFFFLTQKLPFLNRFIASNGAWSIKEWIDAFTGAFSGYPYLHPLWFIRDLFILNLLAVVIKKAVDKFPKITLAVISLLYIFVSTDLIFPFDSKGIYNHEITALCFWCAGYFFVKYNIKLEIVKKINTFIILIPYVILIIFNVVIRDSPYMFIVNRLVVICGVVFWYKISSLINNCKLERFFLYLSSFSFSIYIFHEMNLSYFRKFLVSVLPNTLLSSLFIYFVVPFIIIICCIILSIILNRFTPKLYLLITGSRKSIVHAENK